VANGYCDEGRDITVKVAGGDLSVRYAGGRLVLTGEAALVFEGITEY